MRGGRDRSLRLIAASPVPATYIVRSSGPAYEYGISCLTGGTLRAYATTAERSSSVSVVNSLAGMNRQRRTVAPQTVSDGALPITRLERGAASAEREVRTRDATDDWLVEDRIAGESSAVAVHAPAHGRDVLTARDGRGIMRHGDRMLWGREPRVEAALGDSVDGSQRHDDEYEPDSPTRTSHRSTRRTALLGLATVNGDASGCSAVVVLRVDSDI